MGVENEFENESSSLGASPLAGEANVKLLVASNLSPNARGGLLAAYDEVIEETDLSL